MTNTTDEYWSWNGVSLNQPWWNIASFGGSRQDLPLLRGQNYPVAYRAGQIWRAKQPDQRVITLSMWAAGIDQTSGGPAADQRLAFNNNFQQLRSMFWVQGVQGSALGFLTRRWWVTQSGSTSLVVANALAEVAGTLEPTMSGRTMANLSVDLLLPDPYFYGNQQINGVAANGSGTITNPGDAANGFGQAAGQGGVPFFMNLFGPLTAPIVITNQTAGVSCTVGYTIAAGKSLVLDILSYTAYDQNGTSQLGNVTHAGARPWMILLPGINVISVATGNGGDSGSVDVYFQPPYL
jgi:hypothetical protein